MFHGSGFFRIGSGFLVDPDPNPDFKKNYDPDPEKNPDPKHWAKGIRIKKEVHHSETQLN